MSSDNRNSLGVIGEQIFFALLDTPAVNVNLFNQKAAPEGQSGIY